MTPPGLIDYDKIARTAIEDVATAMRGWQNGRPTSEEALLNRLTERFQNHGHCEVGLGSNAIKLHTGIAELHRQGNSQTDLYGADLAITFYVPGWFLKTAFFQLKRGTKFLVKLERRQLDAAARIPLILDCSYVDCSYVAFANTKATSVRISAVSPLRATFQQPGATSSQFNVYSWMPIIHFLSEWLSCHTGDSAEPRSANNPTYLLKRYLNYPQTLPWEIEKVIHPADLPGDLPGDLLPAKVWLYLYMDSISEVQGELPGISVNE